MEKGTYSEALERGTSYRYTGLCIRLDFIASNVLFFSVVFFGVFFSKKEWWMVVLELFHLFLF